RRLREDRRGQRPKLLAKLNLGVDDLAHVRPTGVGQDTAVPQGAGPPFHPPLKPADNLPRGDLLGRPPAELPFILDLARHASLRQLLPPHPQLPTNLFARELRPPIAVLHDEAARLI